MVENLIGAEWSVSGAGNQNPARGGRFSRKIHKLFLS